MNWLDDICEEVGWRLGRVVYRIKGGKTKVARIKKAAATTSFTKPGDVDLKKHYDEFHRHLMQNIAERDRKIALQWDDPEFRATLRIGTILTNSDSDIRVADISPEGILVKNPMIFGLPNRSLWTWDELKKGKWRIYRQPEASETEKIKNEFIPPDVPLGDIDREIVSELCRLCPDSWRAIRLDAQVLHSNIKPVDLSLAIANPESTELRIQPTRLLYDAISLLFQIMKYRQEDEWDYLVLIVKGPRMGKINFDMRFSYPAGSGSTQPSCFSRGGMLERHELSTGQNANEGKIIPFKQKQQR